MYYVITQKIIPATRETLRLFSIKDLRRYAKDLGVQTGKTKETIIENLMRSGKATLLAQLGD